MKILKKIIATQFILYTIISNFSIVYADNFSYRMYNNDVILTNAESIVVMDADTNVVMFAKNPEVQRFPASITKTMTALLLIEYVEAGNAEYTDTISFSEKAVFSVPGDGSSIGQQVGTTLTVEQALYSLMLPSANEVANAIGEFVSGSTEEFAKLMTTRAKELGCLDTNFANPSGLHDDNHYTTALDMALILDKATEYTKFVEVAGTYNYKFERKNADGTTAQVNINNSNKLINPNNEYYNPNVICGKTGFTNPAKHTLVTYSEVNGHRIIITILYANKFEPYIDTTNLLDFFEDKYHDITLSELSFYETIDIYDETKTDVISDLTIKTVPKTITVPLTVEATDFEYSNATTELYSPPITEGQNVGKANYKLNDSFSTEGDFIAVHDVTEFSTTFLGKLLNILKLIGLGILYLTGIALILIVTIRYVNMRKRKKRREQREEAMRRNNPRGGRERNRSSRERDRNSRNR